MVGDRMSVCRWGASGALKCWRSRGERVVRGGRYVVVCCVCGHMAGCWICLRRCYFGVRMLELLLVWLCCFCVVDVGGRSVRLWLSWVR